MSDCHLPTETEIPDNIMEINQRNQNIVPHALAAWPDETPLGLYRIHWKEGGRSSAAIGMNSDGTRWIAPTNWTCPACIMSEGHWEEIERLELIEPYTKFEPAKDEAIRGLVEALKTIANASGLDRADDPSWVCEEASAALTAAKAAGLPGTENDK